MKKVLFIDDDENILKSIKRACIDEPYTVVTSAYPFEALDLLHYDTERSIKVVVFDHKMPEMLGADLCAKIRKEYPHIVTVMLTGQADIEAIKKAINEGEIFRFITKPFSVNELKNILLAAFEYQEKLEHLRNKETPSVCKEEILKELEKKYPGISNVKRDTDGSIIID